MTRYFIIAIFCLQGMILSLSAQDNNASQEQINQRLQAFTQAFNQGNINALSDYMTDDIEVTRPTTGETVEGKKDIVQFLQKRSQELKDRKLQFSFKVVNIAFPDADTAVVKGIAEVGNDKGLFQRDARQVELVRDNGQWYIDSVRDIEVPPAPPVFNNLKDIEWLVGNWKDQDPEVTITYNNRWGKFKNFIISKFALDVYGLDAMEGIQIIGWDPVAKRIQSWIFDSDGGFGTGTWTKKGDSWEVALDYTLSDGKKATGTNVYTKVDNDHYNYSSINRKVDGKAIPDLEPVSIAREAQ